MTTVFTGYKPKSFLKPEGYCPDPQPGKVKENNPAAETSEQLNIEFRSDAEENKSGPDLSLLTEYEKDLFEERSGLIEYEEGKERKESEEMALTMILNQRTNKY